MALLTDIQANKASNYLDIPTSNQIKLLHTLKTTRDMSLSHEERLKLAIMNEELTEVNRTTLISYHLNTAYCGFSDVHGAPSS